ncbi:MAG: hypothetical protein IT174_10245 [Acidobacteria bacterium]|nr:hypothetical protein [Acidobacteriota bacterium]
MTNLRYNYIGVLIGIVLGLVFFAATGSYLTGAAIGICFAIALGYLIPVRKKDRNANNGQKE